MEKKKLTTTGGNPLASNQKSLTAGNRGTRTYSGLSTARKTCPPEP